MATVPGQQVREPTEKNDFQIQSIGLAPLEYFLSGESVFIFAELDPRRVQSYPRVKTLLEAKRQRRDSHFFNFFNFFTFFHIFSPFFTFFNFFQLFSTFSSKPLQSWALSIPWIWIEHSLDHLLWEHQKLIFVTTVKPPERWRQFVSQVGLGLFTLKEIMKLFDDWKYHVKRNTNIKQPTKLQILSSVTVSCFQNSVQ